MEATQADTKTRTVLIIEDSNAGLRRYADESIDCILLDLHLPDMNGVEFLGFFKKQYALQSGETVTRNGKVLLIARDGNVHPVDETASLITDEILGVQGA